ncbi:MAG: hypothetical protein MUC59_08630 [Saprospiraceae bacterium]|jgi:hypothetical protein|nr:hypothetical protein [Saprospiraceae bacterium]
MKSTDQLSLTKLLYFDGLAGLVVGIFLLAMREPMSGLLGLPTWLLTLQGILNLCYASYSLPLARRGHRPRWMLWTLVVANLAYALFAAVLLTQFYASCTGLGVVYFLLEVVIIGGLGVVEWLVIKNQY